MHNATAQSFNIFLYFALSCAEALLNTILIPIYSSTDNLIISIFIGTVSVGLYSNYVMIVAALKILVDSISGQIAPFIGASYANDKNTDKNLNILNLYTFVKFILRKFYISSLLDLTFMP